MGTKKRRKEKYEGKLVLVIVLILLIFGLYYYDYNFNNSLYNGLLIFIVSVLLFSILGSDKYYIETGFRPEDKTHEDQFKLFNQMHPFLQLYDKLLIIVFFVMAIISVVMIISSFF